MSAELLSRLSVIAFIVAGIAFAIAVFLWIFFRIPRVISDLSGRTARKSIARIRAGNEQSGNKSYRPSEINVDRGMITDTMPKTVEFNETESIEENCPETELLLNNSSSFSSETEALSYSETGVLDDNETVLLNNNTSSLRNRESTISLTIVDEVVLIHNDEEI